MNKRQKVKQQKMKRVITPVEAIDGSAYQAVKDYLNELNIEVYDMVGKIAVIRLRPGLVNEADETLKAAIYKSLDSIKEKVANGGGQFICIDREFMELNVEAIDNLIDGLTKLKEQKLGEFKDAIETAKEKLDNEAS